MQAITYVAPKLIMTFRFKLLFFTLMVSSFYVATPVATHAYEMEDGEYDSIRSISLKLHDDCPRQNCLIAGIGRSPTPFIAFLQNIDPKHAINLPMSSDSKQILGLVLRVEKEIKDHSLEKGSYQATLLDNVLSGLFRHFENFLNFGSNPPQKLVLVDYVANGSFKYTIELMKLFLQARYPTVRLEIFAFGRSIVGIGNSSWLPPDRFISLGDYPFSFERLYFISHYDHRSEFPSFRFSGTSLDPMEKTEPLPAYLEYREELKKHMSSDPILKDHFPPLIDHEAFCDRLLMKQ